MRIWLLRVLGLFGKRRHDRELASEIDGHLEMQIDDNLRTGMTHDEARRMALLKSGGIQVAKDNYHERRGLPWVEDLVRDVRHGVRTLRGAPGFTPQA
jgi:macrolide transport system ATP-binding/permease protein